MRLTGANYTGQQNLTIFLAHEEKYLILVELLKLNSNVQVVFSITHSLFVTAKLIVKKCVYLHISLDNKI